MLHEHGGGKRIGGKWYAWIATTLDFLYSTPTVLIGDITSSFTRLKPLLIESATYSEPRLPFIICNLSKRITVDFKSTWALQSWINLAQKLQFIIINPTALSPLYHKYKPYSINSNFATLSMLFIAFSSQATGQMKKLCEGVTTLEMWRCNENNVEENYSVASL